MKRIGILYVVLLMAVCAWSQTFTDVKCLSLMDVPLEGPDTVFIPAFESVGFTRITPAEQDPDTYYFAGDFYGIKSNMANDYGYIQQSQIMHENGSNSIRYYYLNSAPYYKDVANLGMKGLVQEVITENPVAENNIEHFDQQGKLEGNDLIDRVYNKAGYLVSAAMLEKTGEKSLLTYEYDHENNLKRRTLVNTASGIRSVNEYKYNGDNEISQQSQKVFNKENECVLSITMKNNYEEHDDNGNWTKNTLSLTYWEKDQRAQMATVHQTRTISYWDED